MCDEGVCDRVQMGVDHADVIYRNDASQNNCGSGSTALASEQSANTNAASSDSSSTNVIMNVGLNITRASDLLLGVSIYAEQTRTKILDLARSAMDELSKIVVAGKPLWQPQKGERYETLNEIEYLRQFGQVDATLREIVKLVEVGKSKENEGEDSKIESSRDTADINMSPINLVELLMDVNQWSRVFYSIVSKTTLLGTFSDGVEGSYHGKLHVMSAEFHLPTPVVPTRECYFARYCRQFSPDQWGVVDVSLEKFFPSPSNNLRKRPSGCLITGMPNGHSKVIWMEHVEADHSQLNNLFKPIVTSGFAFGATRWLASIVRHSGWPETLKATKLVADDGVVIPQSGRTSFLKLGDRLMRSFCGNVSGTAGNPWTRIALFPGSTDVRVMVEHNTEGTVNKPRGTTVVFTTTVWLEVSPGRLFNFLRHGNSRNEWDMLSQKLCIQEFAYMVKGEHPGNRVSLLRASTLEGETEIFYLQESYTDSTGSCVVYAPLDGSALAYLAKGSNPDNVVILPSGFAILPGGLPEEDGECRDSVLTVAFHLVDRANANINTPSNITPESVQTIYGIITETVTAIKDAVLYRNESNSWKEIDEISKMA